MSSQQHDFQQAYQLFQENRLAEALLLIEQSLSKADANGFLLNLQGVIYMQLHQPQKALTAFLTAIPLLPTEPSCLANAANCARQLQQHDLATKLVQALFELTPTPAQALKTGIDLYQAKENSLALHYFKRADPYDPDVCYYSGLIYVEQKEWIAAARAFQAVLSRKPTHWEASFQLAHVLESQADASAAIAVCKQALQMRPGQRQISEYLAKLYLKQNKWEQASQGFETILFQQRGQPLNLGGTAESQLPPPQTLLIHKLEHDLEQINYLLEQGLLPLTYRAVQEDLQRLKQELGTNQNPDLPLALNTSQQTRLAAIWGRNLYLEPSPFSKQSVINPDLDTTALENSYLDHSVGLVVVDNLLKPEICEHVYRYATRSTIWNGSDKQGGYVGAFMHDGLASGLVYQIAKELRDQLPGIFKQALLKYMWAFKYDSQRRGINVHGDQAAINVNFWVTPDSANLDPQSGGLIVYDKKAPANWSFEQMNLSNQSARIYQFLDQSQAQAIRVPYRYNRAVIFCSDLFHATDYFHFKPDYLSRRINFTLLYGERDNLL